MKYNFDEVINRKNTNCVKWDSDLESDILPMWIADMDFKVADPIIKALEDRVKHGVFGYADIPEAYYKAEIKWWEKRHNFRIKKEWIEVTTGVIPALSAAVQAFTEPGDKVLIQSPVYNYFNTSITNNKCSIVLNELNYNGRSYEIDFEDFEKKASDPKVKIFILCNPHNPIGIAWRKDTLERLGEICLRHNVVVVVDEIHRDLVYKERTHMPFASISKGFLMNSITCTAPSKTFNLAGLKTSNIIVANEEYRKKINRSLNINETIEPNIFGIEGLIAAYNYGEEWLSQLLEYLEGNLNFLISFIDSKLPGLKVVKPSATYLIWIDCRKLGISSKEFCYRLLHDGKLRISDGSIYGKGGEGFIRINIACSRTILEEGLNRLAKVVNLFN
ncbi:MalY/PatB family protein [Clostridium felsineum]|uniref:cysteine-S-conjugate beta-lyase n=1 Tax=Clostridium felsineum TaxID=36839 RepID=A0A1S8LQP1_9CLOT|nr:MalY/PatB family protein [Clostridium felsineum]URZ05549.1 Cystathionine beta-lyase PatB [Clostridium felsineum]URZ10588.1 Cystathionine beta-lyase PatB [Clostridium felsineum]URZ17496.1 Cystathionine beta-lyase PatB [Clostridium felsineum DSM 794]